MTSLVRRRIASVLALASAVSNVARAAAAQERDRRPDPAALANVWTPIAGAVSLSEMKRPDDHRLASDESPQAVGTPP
jgi:hypothetical protein